MHWALCPSPHLTMGLASISIEENSACDSGSWPHKSQHPWTKQGLAFHQQVNTFSVSFWRHIIYLRHLWLYQHAPNKDCLKIMGFNLQNEFLLVLIVLVPLCLLALQDQSLWIRNCAVFIRSYASGPGGSKSSSWDLSLSEVRTVTTIDRLIAHSPLHISLHACKTSPRGSLQFFITHMSRAYYYVKLINHMEYIFIYNIILRSCSKSLAQFRYIHESQLQTIPGTSGRLTSRTWGKELG